MIDVGAVVRDCLISLDVARAREVWRYLHPDKPPPRFDHDVLVLLHAARTSAQSVPLHLRRYSHSWLVERGLTSMLSPEDRPVVVEGVGFAALRPQPHTPLLRRVAEDAVMDIYADDDHPDPDMVRARVREVTVRERRKLGL